MQKRLNFNDFDNSGKGNKVIKALFFVILILGSILEVKWSGCGSHSRGNPTVDAMNIDEKSERIESLKVNLVREGFFDLLPPGEGESYLSFNEFDEWVETVSNSVNVVRSDYYEKGLNPTEDELLDLWDVGETEMKWAEIAATVCYRGTGASASRESIVSLLRWEVILGVPTSARGILVATWCWESGFRNTARGGGQIRGDFRNGVPMAWGQFQMWPWMRRWCNLKRGEGDNLYASSGCWWRRLIDRATVRGIKWNCAGDKLWISAEALVANGPFYLKKGCRARSHHMTELARWRRGGVPHLPWDVAEIISPDNIFEGFPLRTP